MSFIDELNFHAVAGRGGNGVVRWRQEKFIDKGGPNGGDGGRGGAIYVRAVRDLNLLAKYKHKKKFMAEDGDAGKGASLHGKSGEDLYIDLPRGSVVTNKQTGKVFELTKEGETVKILTGGDGGFGNEHFKSSTNRAPQQATDGKFGEEYYFHIELRLFADIGLVGLPNAGKSSLLNALTNASAKIGAYQFTTLEPNLGDFYGFVIADIPGLIEGASEGRGLGTKFLRHIRRTNMLAHLVSFENPDMMKTYKEIRKELEAYNPELAKKDEIIVLTKTDVTDGKIIKKAITEFKKLKKPIFTLSLYDDASVKDFGDELVKILGK